MNRYVVFDCDIGTDDAWALLMLIKGEEIGKKQQKSSTLFEPYKILGVTCVQGNTDIDNATKNALRVLDAFDRPDIPVFRGCSQPILPRTWERDSYFHGLDGFGDLCYENDVAVEKVEKKHAVTAMYDFACRYPQMVDYVLLGPLTNFAMCINLYGDDFLSKVRSVHVMGGNIRGKGNITKSAEFNFMLDPEAAHIVLERIHKTPLFILPWEPCIDGDFDTTLAWRLDVLGAIQSKAIQLMNRVDSAVYVPKGFVKWIICDALLMASYLFPNLAIAESRKYHATVELNGTSTRGQMVLDHKREKAENATVILKIDKDNWRKIISWTAGLPGYSIEDICK